MKKANSVVKSKQDMEKITKELLKDKKVVIHLDRTDYSHHVIYPDLKYYIDFTDVMNDVSISTRIVSALYFHIQPILKKNGFSIDRLVIPTESNVILGIRLAKLLEIEPIIMHNKTRRIYGDQYWDGVLEHGDKLLIVHDVIYSADNIVDCINHLPEYCSIMGVVSFITRTDNYKIYKGKDLLKEKNVPLYSVAEVDDNYLNELNCGK